MDAGGTRPVDVQGLTDQERRVAWEVTAGRSNKGTAQELGISVKTVEFHLGNVYRKLGVASRGELAHLMVGAAERVPEPAAGTAEDLPAGRPGHLPAASTRLHGREDDLALLDDCLTSGRLITVTGVGGVGKTTIAVAAAPVHARRFAGGGWFVDLTIASTDDDVSTVAAAALGITLAAHRRTADELAEALDEQSLLIVLDNCGHVVAGAADLAGALLRRCPNVVLLATSRERLDAPEEQVVPLRPLRVETEPGTSVHPSPAAELFCERAGQAVGRFAPDAEEHATIEAICRQLDGLPLAIELAAARLPALSVAELAARLDDRLALLRRRHPRHACHDSLHAAIGWSYELLGPREQRCFAALSVFPGDFVLDAAVAVTNAVPHAGPSDDADPVDDVLLALVDRSLLVAARTDRGTRYRMLRTVRAFALERLDELDDPVAVRRAHLDHYVRFMAVACDRRRGPDELRWHHALRRELHNCRAAFRTASDLDAGPEACAIIRHLATWAVTRGITEVARWADEVSRMASADASPHHVFVTGIRAIFATTAGDLEMARRLTAEARDEDARAGGGGEPFALFASLWPAPTFEECAAFAAEIEARGVAMGDPYWEGIGASMVALMLARSPASPRRDAVSQEHLLAVIAHATRLADAVGNPTLIACCLQARGAAERDADPDGARAHLSAACALAEELGCWSVAVDSRIELIRLESSHGDAFDVLYHVEALVGQIQRGAVESGARRAVYRFAAECIGVVAASEHGPEVSTVLQDDVAKALGHDEFDQRVATGAAADITTAVQRFFALIPW